MAMSLLQGTGVDGKKFAAGCINAVFGGTDLWARLISLELFDGRGEIRMSGHDAIMTVRETGEEVLSTGAKLLFIHLISDNRQIYAN